MKMRIILKLYLGGIFMAVFYNQATLSYNDNVINSNIVTGEIVDVLTASKTATLDTYTIGDEITYIISIVNAGAAEFTELTIIDNLGEYAFGAGSVVPLTYVDGSVRYFADGVLQAAPTVTDENPLTITGITVPAKNVETVVNAMQYYIQNPQNRIAMSLEARRQVEEKYEQKELFKKLAEHRNELLQNN